MSGATFSHFRGVDVLFAWVFLRFVESRLQPFHAFEGSTSILLSPFEVRRSSQELVASSQEPVACSHQPVASSQ
jgi:hypothetical protein